VGKAEMLKFGKLKLNVRSCGAAGRAGRCWNNPERAAQGFVQNPLNLHYPEFIYRKRGFALHFSRLHGNGQPYRQEFSLCTRAGLKGIGPHPARARAPPEPPRSTSVPWTEVLRGGSGEGGAEKLKS